MSFFYFLVLESKVVQQQLILIFDIFLSRSFKSLAEIHKFSYELFTIIMRSLAQVIVTHSIRQF
jgi:hypothetical protein